MGGGRLKARRARRRRAVARGRRRGLSLPRVTACRSHQEPRDTRTSSGAPPAANGSRPVVLRPRAAGRRPSWSEPLPVSSAVPFPGCGAPRYDGAGALAALDVEAVYVTPAARLQAAGALAPDASWRAAADLVGDPPGRPWVAWPASCQPARSVLRGDP